MYKVTEVNLELTDKCQAACPMCARNINGGKESPHVKNIEMSLVDVKKWFPPEWVSTINRFVASGNNGDPVVAKDCYAIFEYLIEHSDPLCRFKIFTNGSLRTIQWWESLAKLFKTQGEVTFAIDGFAKEHVLYRRNTSWDKIIENAKAFINAGGQASANVIVFKHNEDTVEDLKIFLLSIGFKQVEFIYTPRFLGSKSYPVMNKDGVLEYYLEPPASYKDLDQSVIPIFDSTRMKELVQTAVIEPMCYKELYVDPAGNVYPCNHLQRWANEIITKADTFIDGYKVFCQREALEIMSTIGYLNLSNTNIHDALLSSSWDKLSQFWQCGSINGLCASACSNMKDAYL